MKQKNIQELFSLVAERHGPPVAIERGTQRVTYQELEENSNRLANFLISSGVTKGSIVAIITSNTVHVVMAIIGILKAGCVFAPFDPRLPINRLKAMTAQIGLRALVIDAEHFEQATEVAFVGGEDLRIVCLDAEPSAERNNGQALFASYAEYRNLAPPGIESDPDAVCSIYFTSGSTGMPKAIAGRLKGIAHFASWEIETLGLTENTRGSQLTSPSWDAFLRDVFVPLCAGGTVCAPESRDLILDARALRDWIDANRLNILHCVPSLFRSLNSAELVKENFSELRYVLLSGEPLLPADVGQWMDVFGERIQLINLYGPTETTLTKLFYFVQASDRDRHSVPIGKPMRGAAAVLVDAEAHTCPPGEVGEILIRTPYRAHGYYNQPELTAEVFIPNPFSNDPNDIVYRTGDYGRLLEDGNLEFVGRKDHQVKIRGVRIELAEVENLLRRHEHVSDVAVADREDALGNKYLCAYVVLNSEIDPSELKHHLEQWLPAFMMPSAIIKLSQLPRTVNGKLDRGALPAPGADDTGTGAVYVSPRTAIEEEVARIWAAVLDVERVGVDDNFFFELGGNSLLATLMIARVTAALQTEVPLRQLFESPTVAGLAKWIETARRNGSAPMPQIEHVPRDGVLPLSFAQQRLWFLDQLESGSAFYNVPAAVRLRGPLNVDALWLALREVVHRHEALRTTFINVNGEPQQSITPELELPLDLQDLSQLDQHEREAAVESYATEWAFLPFDLARGPLVRVRLLRLGDEEHVLLFSIHHIVGDLWSMGVLVREWAILYEAFFRGQSSPLEELPVQYVDFAVWQREWLRGEVLDGQLEYWRRQLADAAIVLNLPTDRPRGRPSFEGARLPIALSTQLSIELEALSRREGATLFMTLLAGFGATLHYQTREDDILIGSPIANRQQLEVENLIGVFLNTLVLRLDFAGDPTFRDLLARVRETALGAYAHQDLPFEKLVEELRPERSLNHNPLFQVAFTLDQVPVRETKLADLTLTPVDGDKAMVQFELVMHLANSREGVIGTLQYQTDLFEADTMKGFREQFENVLHLAVARTEIKLSEIAARLDEIEQRRWADKQQAISDFGLEKLKRARRQAIA